MFTKLRKSYHQAHTWAHHHTAVLVFGLTVLATTFGWQFGSHFIDSKTHASYDPTPWVNRCDTNSGSYVIDTSECYALANIYAQLDGPDWNINFWPPEVSWFSNTDIDNWHGIDLLNNHVDRISLYGLPTGAGVGADLDFSGLPYLTYLRLRSSELESINLNGNTLLKYLDLRYHPNLTSLDLSMNTNLQHLDLQSNSLSTIDVSNLGSLEVLSLSYNNITYIDVSGNPLLKQISIAGGSGYNNSMTGIDLSNNPNIEHIDMHSQGLTSIDLTNKPFLKNINLENNNLSGTIDISSSINLYSLNIAGNNITSIILPTGATGVNSLYLQNNNLTSLDLYPIIGSTGSLRYLYLQNNSIASLGSGFDQFINIGFMSMRGEHINQMNGNCLDPQTLSPSYISFLDSKFANWQANQTCGRDVSEEEYNTLVALYNATDGDNWANNDGWLEDYSVCDWYGITCGGNNTYVQSIYLQTNGLSGYIPPLQGLSNLTHFYADNWNDDNLPDNILDVDLASFANMPNLQSLSIYAPQTIAGSLDDLLVTGLVTIPGQGTTTVVLNQLKHLQLSNPQKEPFVYSPAQLANFTTLESIYLSNNIIIGDLSTLASLVNIQNLDLSCYDIIEDCAVTGTLNFLQYTPNIISLYLGSLNLEGTLPASINNLENLEYLSLNENNFTGPLPTLAASTNLKEIQLQSNKFSGNIPSSRSSLSNLERIEIGGKGKNNAYITGPIPSDWANLPNLKSIRVQFTKNTGILPPAWSNLDNLIDINIFFTQVQGEIPESWEVFADRDMKLWIWNNHLAGDIPAWMGETVYPAKIDNNCLNTDIDDQNLIDHLNTYMPGWQNQNNCLSDMVVTKTLSKSNPQPGETFTLTINYQNNGTQKAPNFEINEALDEHIEFISSVPINGVPATINKTFGVHGDACYDDFLYNHTGPYHAFFATFLRGITFGGDVVIPPEATDQEVFDTILEQELQIPLEVINMLKGPDGINDPNLTSAGLLTSVLCTLGQGIDVSFENLTPLRNVYNELGTFCAPLFGLNYRATQDQCGLGGEAGYRFTVGDVLPGATGTITLTLRLKPNLTMGSQHNAITYLVLDGENLGSNIISKTITVGGSQSGNGGGNTGGGGSSGGGGGGAAPLPVDDCSNYIPPIDKSSSYYDADCEPAEDKKDDEQKKVDEEHKAPFDKEKVLPTIQEILAELAKIPAGEYVDRERVEAYLMAKKIGMTTMPDFMAFRPGEEITRAAAAKYFVQYVETVLGKSADESRRAMCSTFDDIDALKGQDLHDFVIRACMHKLMGLEKGVSILSSFRPYDNLPRAESATMVSRLLYGTTYDNTKNQYATRYEGHMQKLLADKIITDGNPNLIEKRVYPLLMFLRWIKGS